ncbi:MAG TPA: efflux RND transporter periplasmic adaptor subunit [Bryobacteraceae bacterium]|nr:efflux RND transporter periplasmic adaptor subunit [Bryobacteraceae bacterium]
MRHDKNRGQGPGAGGGPSGRRSFNNPGAPSAQPFPGPRPLAPSPILVLLALACPLWSQELATVTARPVSRRVELPGEIQPYLSVALHAKIPSYVERMLVDRGSVVKQGELLAELSAPEMAARIAELESRVQSAESERAQAEAQLAAAQATYESLKKAAETPGAIAGNELVQAQKQVEAAQALVRARQQGAQAAQGAVKAQRDLEQYLKITAPFDGVVTERDVHPGALVGPGADAVLVVVQQISRLRLVVPVPEEDVGGMARGAIVTFRVPAFPDRQFSGVVARIAHALDTKTRTMAVELDVANREGVLSPGMYPAVEWPIRRAKPALFVPKTAVVSTTERVFVIRNRGGKAEWVDVKKGVADGDLVEVAGALEPGDQVVKRGTDELHEGAALK